MELTQDEVEFRPSTPTAAAAGEMTAATECNDMTQAIQAAPHRALPPQARGQVRGRSRS